MLSSLVFCEKQLLNSGSGEFFLKNVYIFLIFRVLRKLMGKGEELILLANLAT